MNAIEWVVCVFPNHAPNLLITRSRRKSRRYIITITNWKFTSMSSYLHCMVGSHDIWYYHIHLDTVSAGQDWLYSTWWPILHHDPWRYEVVHSPQKATHLPIFRDNVLWVSSVAFDLAKIVLTEPFYRLVLVLYTINLINLRVISLLFCSIQVIRLNIAIRSTRVSERCLLLPTRKAIFSLSF